MSKKISIPAAIALIALCCILTFQITFLTVSRKYEKETDRQELSASVYEKLDSVDKIYRSKYIGEIDEEQLEDYLIRGYVVGAGDKYASYMTADDYAQVLMDYSGSLVGIGVHVVFNGDYGAIEVISVVKDSPAEVAGMLPGDLIVSVEGESVSELGYYPAIAKVKGEEGTVVRLSVLRGENASETMNFSIVRAVIEEPSVTFRMYDSKIGIVEISQFISETGKEVKDAVQQLQNQGAEKLVFDLRYNPGGLLSAITETLDFLLPEGPIVRIYDRDNNENVYYSDASEVDLPICILVNGSTASAAELFTSALRDYNKATVIGTTTYGKGTVQYLTVFSDGSALYYSGALYSPPFSDNFEGIGIVPDVVVEPDEVMQSKNFYKLTDEEDNQLQAAIKHLNSN